MTETRYFNSRSREGATDWQHTLAIPQLISIHAPVRERLEEGVGAFEAGFISIHAPVRERLAIAG